MIKYIAHILLFGLLFSACANDEMPLLDENGSGNEITLVAEGMPLIETRSLENGQLDNDSRVEHVILCVFDQNDGNRLLQGFQQEVEGYDRIEARSIFYKLNMLIPTPKPSSPGQSESGEVTLCAICNAPELWSTVSHTGFTLDELQQLTLEGSDANIAYSGRMVMYGQTTATAAQLKNKGTALRIPVRRVAAKVNLEVRFEPEVLTDRFYLSAIELHQIPLRSYLADRPNMAGTTESAEGIAPNTGDAVYSSTLPVPDNYYQKVENMEVWEGDKYTYPSGGNHAIETRPSFAQAYLFENRRGKEADSYFEQIYTERNKFQHLKGKLGKDKYPDASYFLIRGVYVSGPKENPLSQEVSYRIYIGKNNYSDFNVDRNGHYQMTTTIKTVDDLDTRVESKILNVSKINPFFENPMDAHYGAGKCFGFTGNNHWELYVEDPDQHPWLEISFSERYHPRQIGKPIPAGEEENYVGTYFSGDHALSKYFYVHVDEYIPENATSEENLNLSGGTHIALNENMWRKGTIVLRDKDNGSEARIEVKQRPAQFVKMPLYNLLGQVTGYNEFYIEYELEQKNLTWGFLQFPANPVMTSMINDRWDGLANTRRLYQEAIRENGAYNSDQWPPMVAYPSSAAAAAALPTSDMIGYVMTKNRDNNGNGHIDYDEIKWYVPALNELLELWRAHKDGKVVFEAADDRFHSSTPYLAGYTYEVPGRCFYVKTDRKKGDEKYDFKRTAFTMRDRQYNVICCRRKNAWSGAPNGELDGNVEVNPDWNPDQEDIMDKK